MSGARQYDKYEDRAIEASKAADAAYQRAQEERRSAAEREAARREYEAELQRKWAAEEDMKRLVKEAEKARHALTYGNFTSRYAREEAAKKAEYYNGVGDGGCAVM